MRSFQGMCASLRYGLIRVGLEVAVVRFVRSIFQNAAGRGVILVPG